ncbi:MAG: 4-hydroxy-3-methylbut-2-enyl diphosphate reductase [Proteobacteria bacterium]|nr:4-hydroxy-3-methylbut-2-enyl diphosphate reductase [Pseudomonadota bacterium]|tara:strand:+ start:403 stop:1341 length:939 start_codon:yes stop_codon:yes gene_type:complete
MKIYIAKLRGFCAGVDRAIEIVKRALQQHGRPIYVRHEVVHNRFVVEKLKEEGAIFVEEIEDVPSGSVVIFSAHGVSQAIRDKAKNMKIKIYDATCPLVTKVHREVQNNYKNGRELIMIGHKGHPEVEGTTGQIDGRVHLVESEGDVKNLVVSNPDKLAFVTQTTLSVDDTASIVKVLKEKFPKIVGPKKDDICYATQNRQDGVRELAKFCDVILVVGSPNSSNSNRLREVASKLGVDAYMLDNPVQLDEGWFSDDSVIGVTAGASAPEVLVQQVLDRLKKMGSADIEEIGTSTEDVVFRLPRDLQEISMQN